MKRLNTKFSLSLVAIVALAVLVYSVRRQFVEAWNLLDTVSVPLLIGGVIVIQIYSYYANAKFYQSLYDAFGSKISLSKLFKVSLSLNFINVVIPTLGASGISYLSYVLKNDAPKGQSAFGQLARYILTYVSFIGLLLIGGLFLQFGGGISRLLVRIIVLLVLGIIILSFVLVYIMINKHRMNQAIHWLVSNVNSINNKFRKNDSKLINTTKTTRILNEFHDSFDILWRQKQNLVKPVWYALLGNLAEVATVYLVFISMGVNVNPGAVIIAYALATLAGVITFIPGSIGLYESIMIAGLTATGLSLALSLTATLLYRITNMSIFLPLGYVVYEKMNRELGMTKEDLQVAKS